jgi:hypothetical protein
MIKQKSMKCLLPDIAKICINQINFNWDFNIIGLININIVEIYKTVYRVIYDNLNNNAFYDCGFVNIEV